MDWYSRITDSIADFLDKNRDLFAEMKNNVDEGRKKADAVYARGVEFSEDGKTLEGNAFKVGAAAMAAANTLTAGLTTKIENDISNKYPEVKKGWESIGELAESGLSDLRQDPDKDGISKTVSGVSKTATAAFTAAGNAATLGAAAAFGTNLGEDVFNTQQARIADAEAKWTRANDGRHARLGLTSEDKAKDAQALVSSPSEIEHAKVAERNGRMLTSSEAKATDAQAGSIASHLVDSAIMNDKIHRRFTEIAKQASIEAAAKHGATPARDASELDYITQAAASVTSELEGGK